MGFIPYCVSMIKDKEQQLNDLRWHQSQLYHFLRLYYDKERYTDQERDYYKKFTDASYRKHLHATARLQQELNKCGSEAIL